MSNTCSKYSALPFRESSGESQIYNLGSVLTSFVILSKSFNFSEFQFPTAFILEAATLTAVRRVLVPGGRFVILPEGHLTGEGPVYTFIEWLFTITGQRPREGGPEQVWRPFEQRLGAAGFEVAVETVRLEGSAATVIVAAVE